MNSNSRVYVAGHTGLVGSAITHVLLNKGYNNLIFRKYEDLDLSEQDRTDAFFKLEKPEFVFLAAAKVGGIVANNSYRADFIYDNIMIESNVIRAAWKHNVKKLLFLGSTCIYPKNAPQPLKESSLLTSQLEYTNEPYAIAKIAGLKMCESFNLQYGTDFIAVMPANLYGPSDNYDLEKSHVLPALVRKIHLGHCLEENDWESVRKDINKNPIEGIDGSAPEEEILKVLEKYGIKMQDEGRRAQGAGQGGGRRAQSAELRAGRRAQDAGRNKTTVILWGTGKPLREFMYSRDLAGACVYLMENVTVNDIQNAHLKLNPSDPHPPHFLNIGTGAEISIRDLALKIRDITGFSGKILFDNSKPDGTFRKVTDTTVLKSLGFVPETDLDSGLRRVYEEYVK